jgi:hypothetical protein
MPNHQPMLIEKESDVPICNLDIAFCFNYSLLPGLLLPSHCLGYRLKLFPGFITSHLFDTTKYFYQGEAKI